MLHMMLDEREYAIETYKEVLSRSRKKFPDFFWSAPMGLIHARDLVRYLIEERLKWDDKQVKEKWCIKTLVQNRLGGMLVKMFNGSAFAAIENAYPGKYKVWEMKVATNAFWDLETGKEATKWLIEEKLRWSDDQVKDNICKEIFIKNGLQGMLIDVFKNNYFIAIENAYPGKYKKWEFRNVCNNFWTLETAKEATKWLIEEKLKWSDEQVKESLTQATFIQNGLSGMLGRVFKGSPFAAIENAYPGRYKVWEFKNAPKCFWTLETAKEATKWLIEEKLKWSDEQVKESLTQATFIQNGLFGMLNRVFKGSPFAAIENAYPGKYKKWEFKVPSGFWNLDTAKEATKWLIEEKLKWSDDQVKRNLCQSIFVQNDLSGMLSGVFKDSSFAAIENAYPGKYKVWEFTRVPKGFWTLETAKEATKWLIEEKLKWNDCQVRQNLDVATFRKNRLGGMLNDLFNNSIFKALENAYPGKYSRKNRK